MDPWGLVLLREMFTIPHGPVQPIFTLRGHASIMDPQYVYPHYSRRLIGPAFVDLSTLYHSPYIYVGAAASRPHRPQLIAMIIHVHRILDHYDKLNGDLW